MKQSPQNPPGIQPHLSTVPASPRTNPHGPWLAHPSSTTAATPPHSMSSRNGKKWPTLKICQRPLIMIVLSLRHPCSRLVPTICTPTAIIMTRSTREKEQKTQKSRKYRYIHVKFKARQSSAKKRSSITAHFFEWISLNIWWPINVNAAVKNSTREKSNPT